MTEEERKKWMLENFILNDYEITVIQDDMIKEKKTNMIKLHKRACKLRKKFANPDNLSLMQIQHNYAKERGYKNWKELLIGANK